MGLTMSLRGIDLGHAKAFFRNRGFLGAQTQTTVSSAGCCTITSLDELASFGNKTDHHGHHSEEVSLPSSAGDIAMSSVVSYLSLAGLKVAWDLFKYHRESAQAAQTQLSKLPEDMSSAEHKALSSFLKRCRLEAHFQQWIAGGLSGLSSAAILLSQAIMVISPVGLGIMSCYGLSHFFHNGRNLAHQLRARRRLPDDAPTAQKRYINKKIKNLAVSVGSWLLYTSGASCLTAVSVSICAMGMMSNPVTASLALAGLILLGTGIAGTVSFNNIVTGARFLPFLPKTIKIQTPPTQETVITELARIERQRLLVKGFRRAFFQRRKIYGSATLGKYTHGLMRFLTKSFNFLTVGLLPKRLSKWKRQTKEWSTRQVEGIEQIRLDLLSEMDPQVSVPQRPTPSAHMLLTTLQGHKHRGAICKLLAHRVGEYTQPWWNPLAAKKWAITNPHPFFQEEDQKELLEVLINYKPCCPGNAEGGELLENLQDYIHKDPSSQSQLLKLLEEVTDQYYAYQMRNDLKRELCFWSEYLSYFDQNSRVI